MSDAGSPQFSKGAPGSLGQRMWVVETPGDDGIKVILFLFNLTTTELVERLSSKQKTDG